MKSWDHPLARFAKQQLKTAQDFQTALRKDISRPGTSLLAKGPYQITQITAVFSTLPLFLLTHILLVATITPLLARYGDLQSATIWLLCSYLIAGVLILMWRFYDPRRRTSRENQTYIRLLDLLAVLFAMSWACCPILFFPSAKTELFIMILGLTLAASAIGTLAFSRLPSAAILYCLTITTTLVVTVLYSGKNFSIIYASFTVAYGALLTGLVLKFSTNQQRQALQAQDAERQKDVVALLLNEFEQGSSDWVWECDMKLHLTYASPRFLEVLGQSEVAVLDCYIPTLTNHRESKNIWRTVIETMSVGEPLINVIIPVTVRERACFWRINARPLYGQDNALAGYRGVGRDVTEEVETDRNLISAKEAAEAASQAKSHFLAIMSHELRTPLNAILGFAEMIAIYDDVRTNVHQVKDYATTILDSSRHLQTLINDILEASRIENGVVTLFEQETDVADLVEVAMRMCRSQAEKSHITLIASLPDAVDIFVDMTRVKQILLNLLTNAIKFSPPHSRVMIDVSKLPNHDMQITVSDHGIGVRPEDYARIFEPFVQTEEGMARRYGGMGLGLSIARRIARLHGGDITVRSVFGQKTTLKFTLPASRIHWAQPKATQLNSTAA